VAFIAAAEETGLIVPIGRWVLHEACRQAARWQASGLPRLFVAVNLSAMQFRQGIVEADVRDALAATGLDPALLELELTESILLQSDDMVMSLLRRWKQLGIRLTIDDFGTGYSSLAYLKRLAVDKLKIDRSFVTNLRDDEQDRAIVLAMLQIARSLRLATVAEGIEDAEVVERLRAMGCEEVQGYLYARPQPAEVFEQWLRACAGKPAPAHEFLSTTPSGA
jgi:EAL domain-containing protein (putative c-di-GMP-specific phosphodiesterase class I)